MLWIIASQPVRVELVEPWWKDVGLPAFAATLSVLSIGLTLVLRWWDGARLRVETIDSTAVRIANVGRRDPIKVQDVFLAQRQTPPRPWAKTSGGAAPLSGHGVELPLLLEPGDEVTFRTAPPWWERPELQHGLVEDRDTGNDVRGALVPSTGSSGGSGGLMCGTRLLTARAARIPQCEGAGGPGLWSVRRRERRPF